MKKTIIFLLIALMTSVASFAQSHKYQNGYFRKNGTYVTGHYKTCSDRTNHNNFSTRGKRNPYTGIKGEPGTILLVPTIMAVAELSRPEAVEDNTTLTAKATKPTSPKDDKCSPINPPSSFVTI